MAAIENQNNCDTCRHLHAQEPGHAHCYMWKEAPSTACTSHTGTKDSLLTILRAMKSALTPRQCLSCGAVEQDGAIPCGH